MASVHKHIRSGTASKRPTTAIAEGQIALATNIASPGLFFKDSTGATIVKIGPVHVGATAPNVSPAGSAGNSIGEIWLDTSLTPVGVKIWNGSAFVNATPIGSTTVQGLLELATDAETQVGADTARAVTSASLQSKLSDSTSTTSNTTIASSTAVKTAYDLANAALPKTGGTVTGNLEIGTAGSLSFEGATADGFETTIAITDPTADRTITLPNTTGTVVTTGDTGTVTSTMILDGTIVDADINANAEISVSKLVDGSARQLLQTDAAGTGVEWASNIDIPGTLDVTSAATFDSTVAVTGALTKSGSNVVTVGDTGTVTSTMILDGTILNSDVNASAAIAGTKIAPDFGAQTIVTTGVHSAALGAAATPSITFTGDLNTGIFSPGADQLAVATNGVERVEFGTAEVVFNDGGTDYDFRVEGDTSSHLLFVDASTDRVGIGTSSVSELLQVSKTGGANIQVDSGSSNVVAKFGASGAGAFVGSTSNDYFQIYSNNTARIHVTSAGLVGIGVTSPSTALQVVGAISSSGAIYSTDGTRFALLNQDGTNPYLGTAGLAHAFVFKVGDGTGDVERARIDTSGRLLVGTSSGSDNNALLKVQGNVGGSTGTGWIDLRRGLTTPGANSQLGVLSFSDASGNNYALIESYTDATTGTNDYPGRLVFSTTADGASSPTERMRISANGNVNVVGALSKGSGSFRIDHPLSEKKDTHHLIHSFIEGPQADLIYRGHVNLINGKAIINIDEAARMAEGTFNALCTNVCCFTSNESDWTAVRGSVSDNILTIEAQDLTSTAEVCWMVIGERKDQHMLDTNWTDENGRVITEPLKEVTPSVTP